MQPASAQKQGFAPLWSLGVAFAFLTRLGFLSGRIVGGGDKPGRTIAKGDLARAGWAFPFVGLVVGTVGGGVCAGALALALPPLLAAILGVAAMVLLTGALHEDGLADVADGFGGAFEREAKLKIMRDSRIGTFGVVALFLVLAGRLAAVAAIEAPLAAGLGIVAAAVLSRATMVWLMAFMPPARESGLGAEAGRPGALTAGIAAVITVALAVAALGPLGGAIGCVAAAVVAALFAGLAMRQIGGSTGDVLGAAQQLTEVAVLVAAAVTFDRLGGFWG
ncbi:MAG: adenosylcobinamide-GDP ribazoletransferase [Alphaproteobacteria bacterium]|nr:adenosylcobinamide-GDP ribazoletransferase [Alphaproteobacteria bacterium]